jgi:hypothetical protein
MSKTNNTRKKTKKSKKRLAKHTRSSNFSKKKIDLFRYYSKNFKGTDIIPVTSIINYMKQHYDEYDAERQISLDDLFNFNNGLKPGLKKFLFDSPVDGNPDFSLDKLISYVFYSKTRSIFINPDGKPTDQHFYLERLKHQMGKDIRRQDSTINGKEYDSSIYYKDDVIDDQDKNYYKTVDMYYQILINYFYTIDKINFDIINKIGLLSCQNIFNFVSELITLKINELISQVPGCHGTALTKAVKSIDIIIKKDVKTMQFNFRARITVFKDDVEICGLYSFKFLADFMNNTFKFNEFKIKYDIDDCKTLEYIELNDNQADYENINDVFHDDANNANDANDANNANGANGENGANGANINLKYAIPAALGVGAAIATPFLLGVLGGKKNTTMKKNIIKNKTKKYIKHNKTKK